jgi:quercetin dioxygenase-like cupin family protein
LGPQQCGTAIWGCAAEAVVIVESRNRFVEGDMAISTRVLRRAPTALIWCLMLASAAAQTPAGTIRGPDEGEHLMRRWGYPLTIKIDPLTAGSKDFVAGTEDLAPGTQIPMHRHHHMEEIVMIQSGDVVARIGDQQRVVGPGAMAFGPPNTWMCFQNVGTSVARVTWIFSRPGFETYVRATSVPLGQPVVPLTAAELDQIRQKYIDEIELAAPAGTPYPGACLDAVPRR